MAKSILSLLLSGLIFMVFLCGCNSKQIDNVSSIGNSIVKTESEKKEDSASSQISKTEEPVSSDKNENSSGVNQNTQSKPQTQTQTQTQVQIQTQVQTQTQSQTPTKNPVSSNENKEVNNNDKNKEEVKKTPLTPISPEDYYGWQELKKEGSGAEQKAYKLIADAIGSYKKEIFFNFDISQKEAEKAYLYYCDDYPQHFWRKKDPTMFITNKKVIKMSFDFLFNQNEIKVKEEKFNANVNNILSGLSGSLSDFEKEEYIHDYLINNTDYIVTAVDGHDAYGVIVDKEAVCEGYSTAFQHLMRQAGVQTIVVKGMFHNDNTNESHEWNMVRLDGNYYHVDITADDPIDSNGDKILKYDHLNLTTAEINKNHTIQRESHKIPDASNTKYGFFNYNGLSLKKLDNELFVNAILYAAKHKQKYAHIKLGSVKYEDAISYYSSNYLDIINEVNSRVSNKIALTEAYSIMHNKIFNIVSFSF